MTSPAANRTDVGWMRLKDRQLVLVKRSLYDLVTLMTIEEFRATEPSVEAIAIVTKNGVQPVVMRVGKHVESYYAVDLPVTVGALFAINVRRTVEDFE